MCFVCFVVKYLRLSRFTRARDRFRPHLPAPSHSRVFFCAAVCFLAAITSGCSKQKSASASLAHAEAAPQILRLAQRNEPADLDPATATLPDEFFVIRALNEGLLTAGSDGRTPTPALASRWEISADALVYTFHLRPEARWSNGDRVTAADFIASYRRLLSPATAATKAPLFFAVKNARAFATGTLTDFSLVGFAAPDALTLVVTLAQPNPAFLLYAASGPWLPVHPATVATHGRTWTQPAHHIGNGPFTLAEWRQNQRIVVKKNPAYRAAADIRVDEIHFLRFDSGDTEERAYRAGQVDVTMSVPVTKIATYARERPAELQRTPLAETRYLAFNTTRPPLDDPAFRRALSDAIDREKIVDRVLLGGQQAARSFIPPALAPSPVVPTESAPKLFPNVGTIRLELTGWSQTPVLEAIQAMWREKLGLNVTIALRDAKVHVAALRAGAYDIGFITEIPDVADPALVLAQFTTGAPGNYPHWSDARYDAAPSEALLLASAPVAPLYFNTKNWLKSPRVQGWREDPFWTRDYTAVHLAAP